MKTLLSSLSSLPPLFFSLSSLPPLFFSLSSFPPLFFPLLSLSSYRFCFQFILVRFGASSVILFSVYSLFLSSHPVMNSFCFLANAVNHFRSIHRVCLPVGRRCITSSRQPVSITVELFYLSWYHLVLRS